MKRLITKFLLLLSVVISSSTMLSPVNAEVMTSAGASAAFGEGSSSAYSLYLQQTYDPLVTWSFGRIAPTAEIGASLWYAGGDHVFGAYLAPGLRFTLQTSEDTIQPFIGLSLGGQLISDDRFDHDKWKMGGHALFRTKGVAGLEFGSRLQHRIQGEYTRHSTWGITKNHDVFDTYGISYGYGF